MFEISVKQVFLELLHPQLLKQTKLKEVSVKRPPFTSTARCGRAEQNHRPEGSPAWNMEGAVRSPGGKAARERPRWTQQQNLGAIGANSP